LRLTIDPSAYNLEGASSRNGSAGLSARGTNPDNSTIDQALTAYARDTMTGINWISNALGNRTESTEKLAFIRTLCARDDASDLLAHIGKYNHDLAATLILGLHGIVAAQENRGDPMRQAVEAAKSIVGTGDATVAPPVGNLLDALSAKQKQDSKDDSSFKRDISPNFPARCQEAFFPNGSKDQAAVRALIGNFIPVELIAHSLQGFDKGLLGLDPSRLSPTVIVRREALIKSKLKDLAEHCGELFRLRVADSKMSLGELQANLSALGFDNTHLDTLGSMLNPEKEQGIGLVTALVGAFTQHGSQGVADLAEQFICLTELQVARINSNEGMEAGLREAQISSLRDEQKLMLTALASPYFFLEEEPISRDVSRLFNNKLSEESFKRHLQTACVIGGTGGSDFYTRTLVDIALGNGKSMSLKLSELFNQEEIYYEGQTLAQLRGGYQANYQIAKELEGNIHAIFFPDDYQVEQFRGDINSCFSKLQTRAASMGESNGSLSLEESALAEYLSSQIPNQEDLGADEQLATLQSLVRQARQDSAGDLPNSSASLLLRTLNENYSNMMRFLESTPVFLDSSLVDKLQTDFTNESIGKIIEGLEAQRVNQEAEADPEIVSQTALAETKAPADQAHEANTVLVAKANPIDPKNTRIDALVQGLNEIKELRTIAERLRAINGLELAQGSSGEAASGDPVSDTADLDLDGLMALKETASRFEAASGQAPSLSDYVSQAHRRYGIVSAVQEQVGAQASECSAKTLAALKDGLALVENYIPRELPDLAKAAKKDEEARDRALSQIDGEVASKQAEKTKLEKGIGQLSEARSLERDELEAKVVERRSIYPDGYSVAGEIQALDANKQQVLDDLDYTSLSPLLVPALKQARAEWILETIQQRKQTLEKLVAVDLKQYKEGIFKGKLSQKGTKIQEAKATAQELLGLLDSRNQASLAEKTAQEIKEKFNLCLDTVDKSCDIYIPSSYSIRNRSIIELAMHSGALVAGIPRSLEEGGLHPDLIREARIEKLIGTRLVELDLDDLIQEQETNHSGLASSFDTSSLEEASRSIGAIDTQISNLRQMDSQEQGKVAHETKMREQHEAENIRLNSLKLEPENDKATDQKAQEIKAARLEITERDSQIKALSEERVREAKDGKDPLRQARLMRSAILDKSSSPKAAGSPSLTKISSVAGSADVQGSADGEAEPITAQAITAQARTVPPRASGVGSRSMKDSIKAWERDSLELSLEQSYLPKLMRNFFNFFNFFDFCDFFIGLAKGRKERANN
jgi:hypothetical protein